jgi:hypothetical protein
MYSIEIEEKSNFQENKKRQEKIIDSDLINYIHEKYKKKVKFFFLTSFKLEKMEFIWKILMKKLKKWNWKRI